MAKNKPAEFGSVLLDSGQLGPFPTHRLKRVDKPTNLITDDIQRIDSRESAAARAARGDYGPAVKKASARGTQERYPLSAAQSEVIVQLSAIKDNEPAPLKAPIPSCPKVLSRHIKRLGYVLKADIMGICRVPPSAIYSFDKQGKSIDIDLPYAAVIVMREDYRTLSASTGHDWIADTLRSQPYQGVSLIAETMANYLRRLGYRAVPQHIVPVTVARYQVLMPPLLLWAGIGEVSRAGIILNPFLGLGYKSAAVLTDLPLVPDRPIDFGLQDFCQHCKICAEMCPSHAIPTGDKTMYNGYQTWKLDEQKCCSFNRLNKKGTTCFRCVKVCPWTKPATLPHNLVRWAVQRSRLARRLAVKADRFLSPGKVNAKEKWWFDLEEVDGKLALPRAEGE